MTRQQMLDKAADLEAKAVTAMGYWRRDIGGRDVAGAGWAERAAHGYRAAAAALREAAA